MSRAVTIATRGSELALWQARHVKQRLEQSAPGLSVDLLIVKTQGDIILDRPLVEVGGKGLFVKEIEEALLDRRADVAVHSMKDVPAELAPGLVMAAISERADPRDALCANGGLRLCDLPRGARVGTSSLRRVCQLRLARPDLAIASLRGNVPTRLKRLHAGDFDAIVLAAAGLVRLGLQGNATEFLDPAVSLPAVGQGALGIEVREGDADMYARVRQAMHHETDARCVAAERAFLLASGAGCQAPIAAFAQVEPAQQPAEADRSLYIRALIATPDGATVLRAERRVAMEQAEAAGAELWADLQAAGGWQILDGLAGKDPK